MPSASETIGFIGLGKMGNPMLGHLLGANQKVTVFARRRTMAQMALEQGAVWASSPAELVANCSVVFTMVGGPDDVKDLYLGRDGLLARAKPQTCLIDMTTSTPKLAKRIHQKALQNSLLALDAPVTGGVAGAEKATLTFMVGAEATALDRIRPLLNLIGDKIFHMGGAGSGQLAKSCNQIAVAGIVTGMAEALNLAISAGASVEKTYQVLSSGTASSQLLTTLGRKMLDGDESVGFTISHFGKDLKIAHDLAADKGTDLPATDHCREICKAMQKAGNGDKGLQALLEFYQSRNRLNE